MTHLSVFAQAPADPNAPPGGLLGGPLFPFFLLAMFALFWVVFVLPAGRRQKKEQEAMFKSLRRGSKVVTSSGILGTVVSVKDTEDEMVLRSEDARFKMKKSMVVQVIGQDDEK